MGDSYAQPAQPAKDAEGATAALVCGILGLICCGVLSVIAWVLGSKALAQIEASGGTLGGLQNAKVGQILGMVGVGLWVFGIFIGILTGAFEAIF